MKEQVKFHFAHIGINTGSGSEALLAAKALSDLFGCVSREEATAVYACDEIELLKGHGAGVHGHIGFYTNDLSGAIELLERRGIVFDRTKFKYDGDGTLLAAYLQEQVCGFAIHLSEENFS